MPRVGTRLAIRDQLGTLRARIGIARNRYTINPGLYCLGEPGPASPIMVTANYKLSFDALRQELAGIDAWILVIDTRGINVWCAAGKKTFSADEIALQVKRVRLAEIVAHRELLLPQLAAPGVAAHELPKKCWFKDIFGPIRAEDIRDYLAKGKQIDERMRTITFSFGERLVLIPVEIALIWKRFILITLAVFALSGFGPGLYSLPAALNRGMIATGATVLAILAGAVASPLLLPWIPGRQFWWKGLLAGGLTGIVAIVPMTGDTSSFETLGLGLWIMTISSHLAMNFTGATPFTSLSGVEKEMRRGLPVQALGGFLALIFWLLSPFAR